MDNITFEFATQDDCLDKMVPSDLRMVVAERDFFRDKLAETEAKLQETLAGAANMVSVREGFVMVPVEPSFEQIKAMAESRAVDDEGRFPVMIDILDYSGENKAHTVLREAYRAAMLSAAGVE